MQPHEDSFSTAGFSNFIWEGITKYDLKIPFISSVQRTSVWGSYGTSRNYSSVLPEVSQTKLDENDILKLINKHKDILGSIIEKGPAEAYEKTRNHLIDTYRTYSQMFHGGATRDIENCITLS